MDKDISIELRGLNLPRTALLLATLLILLGFLINVGAQGWPNPISEYLLTLMPNITGGGYYSPSGMLGVWLSLMGVIIAIFGSFQRKLLLVGVILTIAGLLNALTLFVGATGGL